MKPKRKLFDMKVDEVSVVNKPANQVKFLVFKSDGTLEIIISSDGTPTGTLIKVNGVEIKDLTSLSVWYNTPLPGSSASSVCGPALSCSYSKVVNMENGFAQTESFTLNKGDCMDEKLVELLKAYFGDKFKCEKKDLSVDAVKALNDALTAVNKYKDEFPDELKAAVGTLAEYASSGYGYPSSGYGYPSSGYGYTGKKAETDEEKKKSLAEEAAAVAAATAKKGDDAVTKQITDLAKSITDLTKAVTDGTEANKKLATDLDVISKRVETVERSAPLRKGIDGQDVKDGNDGNNTIVDKFPSIPM